MFHNCNTPVKISQLLTGPLPEQCLNKIVIMPEQHCWTNNIQFSIIVLSILFSNDVVTIRLFMVPWLLEQGKFVLIEQLCSLY